MTVFYIETLNEKLNTWYRLPRTYASRDELRQAMDILMNMENVSAFKIVKEEEP